MRLLRRPFSLGLRMTLLFGATAAIVMPLFGWVIIRSMQGHFAEGDAAELQVIAEAVQAALPREFAAGGEDSLRQRFDDILVGHQNASLYVVGENGKALYASPYPDLSGLVNTAGAGSDSQAVREWYNDDQIYRILARTLPNTGTAMAGPYTLVAAVSIDYHLYFLAAFRRTLWFMIAGCIVIISLLGWVLVQQGHAPLRDIVARIRHISASELSTRLPPESVPHELTDLAVSFNEMLQRVDASFHRLSDFNADIAHELRTPITNLMTQAQVALSRARTVDEYREILYSNMEEYERMAQMVSDLLFLAQTDNRPHIRNIEQVVLADEVQALFEYYEGLAEERGIALVLNGAATVPGDRHMLRRALGNLLSNAIHHTPTHATVRVKLTAANDAVGIVVENPGTMIPPEHLPRLFDRFYRVDPSRERGEHGAGLGLAIVKSIITAHGGTIAVTSSEAHTRFRITLPRDTLESA